MEIERRYPDIEATHRLTAGVSEHHKCRRQHGHGYVLDVYVDGPIHEDGMVVEYGDLDATIKPVIALIDHHDLNTLHERCSTIYASQVSKNPTVENILVWLFFRLQLIGSLRDGLTLTALRLREDSRSRVTLCRDEFENIIRSRRSERTAADQT